MDRECVSLLPRVCEVLRGSGSSLPDDTSLEKLLDWFTGLTEAGGSVQETCPCLLEFISAVVLQTSSDPGVICFTLKLSGLIAATEDGFKTLQGSVLDMAFNPQHWRDAGLWEDPCIRIGWIQGLRNMLQHSKAFTFFVQADFLVPLLQLQTDSSLFVASAANQTLAHTLIFFQPGCDGTFKDHGKVKRTQTSITDVEPSSQDYSAVLGTISQFLKESLLPKENTRLHQSQQILKLLALLLARARQPLRDKLLGTVADSLEELVAAGYSQLTLPLMDIILAAYSSSSTDDCVPDQRVTRLLSSMLNITKPSDLIGAAAAFLRGGRHHQDTVHTARAVRILLLPLHIITGQTLLGTDTTEEHHFSIAEQLKIKTSCISMICVCLTHTPPITLMPRDSLPCPPVSIITAVLSLLRIVSGDSSSLSSGCSEVFRNLVGSGKVQKCALEVLTGLSSSPGMKDKLTEVVTVLIQYLNNPDSDPTVIHKSYQALLKWMSVCEGVSLLTEKLKQDLIDVVKKRACDMRWEVRDSTVEFLGKLAGVLKQGEETCDALLGGCWSTPLLREALQDPESYVRASAIAALAQTLEHSWHQGAAVTQEQTDVVTRLLEILSQDTEGFARRAVVQYFIAWFSSRSSHTSPLSCPSSSSSSSSSSSFLRMNSVSSVLSLGSADLDWEVKVHTLELAELLMDEACSGHRGYRKGSETPPALRHPYAGISDQTLGEGVESDVAGALSNLVEQGVVSALLSGLVDCDRPVGLKACQLLITLRETVCPRPPLDAPPATATVAKVSCELPGCGWGREVRKIPGMKRFDRVKEADIAHRTRCAEVGTEVASEGGDSVCVGVCDMLRSLGLDEKLDILSQSSDHVHNSALSLLQDILTASAAHTQQDAEPGQEVIVDCY
ncbi:BRCA1-associated ATM activator 1 isoform X3 [Hippoglossus hippoglossus]|uniref:BRCA1-associated ATM activator 1 isoform X3 n=1 Tax=Hippoglossus hippoglossus TaxID=8267 RepID=UPI00148CE68C|nr:BRCA1-associated ATM activator 1 isoform X3 [Hippoglossus hippoglossus]